MNTPDHLAQALRLAVDPPSGVSLDVLRNLTRDDHAEQWDISTTARHLAVSAHTLRYYERIGLVSVARDARGHRSYDAAAVRRLVFLTRMRASGMPIKVLRRYVELVALGPESVAARQDLLLAHREQLRAHLAELQLALPVTEYKVATYQQERPS